MVASLSQAVPSFQPQRMKPKWCDLVKGRQMTNEDVTLSLIVKGRQMTNEDVTLSLPEVEPARKGPSSPMHSLDSREALRYLTARRWSDAIDYEVALPRKIAIPAFVVGESSPSPAPTRPNTLRRGVQCH